MAAVFVAVALVAGLFFAAAFLAGAALVAAFEAVFLVAFVVAALVVAAFFAAVFFAVDVAAVFFAAVAFVVFAAWLFARDTTWRAAARARPTRDLRVFVAIVDLLGQGRQEPTRFVVARGYACAGHPSTRHPARLATSSGTLVPPHGVEGTSTRLHDQERAGDGVSPVARQAEKITRSRRKNREDLAQ